MKANVRSMYMYRVRTARKRGDEYDRACFE